MQSESATQRTVLLIVCLGAFISPLMLSAVNVAIPGIAQDFGATATAISWIPLAYLLSSAVFMLPAGRIADGYGRKRIYQTGMIVITVASSLAALSESIGWLLFCRALQGLGAAMLFATGQAMLASVFPPAKRGRAIGLSVSAVYLGLTAGPALGGWAIAAYGWRASLLIHLPLALLVIGITRLKLTGDWRGDESRKLDLTGSLIYGGALVISMYGLSSLPGATGIACIILGCVGFIVFFRYARRRADPIFDVSLFRTNRLFTFSCLAALAIYAATFSISYLMSLYLQYIKGLAADSAGIIMIGQPLIMTLLSPVAGRLSDKYEAWVLASSGVGLVCVGLGLLASLTADSAVMTVFIYLMLTGMGFALFSAPNMNAIMSSVNKRHLGLAAGSVSTMRVLGQMISMAIVTVVFALLVGPVEVVLLDHDLLMHSIRMSFVAAACLAATAIPLSLKRGNMRLDAG